jgi:hypothetical protein
LAGSLAWANPASANAVTENIDMSEKRIIVRLLGEQLE